MLPQIEHPLHTIQIPSTKKKHNFRPFLVKEEKLLLMAKEGNDHDILRAIKQVVNNCCIDTKFDINSISITDISYLFIRLRAISINNKIKQTYIDNEDGKTYTFEIDLEKVTVYQEKTIPNVIKISKNMGIMMKYPPAQLMDEEGEEDSLLLKCIDKIFEGDEIFLPQDYKKKDLLDFIENLPIPTLEAMNEFINNSPELRYVIKYTNSLGKDKEIVLKTLSDFFIFR